MWVTVIRTLDEALGSLRRLLTVAAGPRPPWLDAAEQAWEANRGRSRAQPSRRAVIPVWRRPWMVLGRDTFAGDVLARLGVANVYAGHAERYPEVPLDDLLAARPDLVVLPDEPYRFTAGDGPESFPGVPAALVSGRHLTWYGPRWPRPRRSWRPSCPPHPRSFPHLNDHGIPGARTQESHDH